MTNESDELTEQRGNPLNGVALVAGMFAFAYGLTGAEGFLIAGAVLFSGGLISLAIQDRSG